MEPCKCWCECKKTVTIGVFVKKVTYGILANVIVSVKKPVTVVNI